MIQLIRIEFCWCFKSKEINRKKMAQNKILLISVVLCCVVNLVLCQNTSPENMSSSNLTEGS